MSDTSFYVGNRRVRISGALKGVMIYVLIDLVMSGLNSFGQFLYSLKEADWTALWGPQKWGLVMMQVGGFLGSALLMLKGVTSKSTRPEPPPTPSTPTTP
jgi:hypothetical protein